MGQFLPQLGNLSALDYLDLGNKLGCFCAWISGYRLAASLYFLKHLDLSRVDLGEDQEWLQAINNFICYPH